MKKQLFKFLFNQETFKKLFNRRKSPRITIAVSMFFRVLSASGKESPSIRATTSDLSCGGLSFLTKTLRVEGEHVWFNSSLSHKNILEIKFNLPEVETPLTLKGEICFFDRLDDYDRNFKIGVHFIEPPEKELKIIKDFIANYKK